MAACAALTVNDVAGAITALHLGHEPEQAAMLALAFGELAGVDSSLLDRVYAALAVRCEAAGAQSEKVAYGLVLALGCICWEVCGG